MYSDRKKRAFRTDMLFSGVIVVMGLAISGFSLAWVANSGPELAQATPPLQSTPGAETKPSAPPDPVTTGTDSRPSSTPPQSDHPDSNAQKQGAAPALPPAPAEKIAPPIKER